MKRSIIVGIIFVAVIIVISIPIIMHNKEVQKYSFKLNIKESESCSGIYEELADFNGKKVYSYCLDEIKVLPSDTTCKITKDNDCLIDLKSYLDDQKKEGLNNIINELKLENELNDGGTKIYTNKKKSKFTNIDLKLISCNTLGGDQNYYFGPASMSEFVCK